jgi:hypothetical protein
MEDVPRFGCLSGGGLVVVVPWWEWPESGRRIRRVCFCLSVKKKNGSQFTGVHDALEASKTKAGTTFQEISVLSS